MSRKLTMIEIEDLASGDKVKRIAVENFLMTVTANPDRTAAIYNARADARAYSWNAKTLQAILKGIDLAFSADR